MNVRIFGDVRGTKTDYGKFGGSSVFFLDALFGEDFHFVCSTIFQLTQLGREDKPILVIVRELTFSNKLIGAQINAKFKLPQIISNFYRDEPTEREQFIQSFTFDEFMEETMDGLLPYWKLKEVLFIFRFQLHIVVRCFELNEYISASVFVMCNFVEE